jgi:hypothetical protein
MSVHGAATELLATQEWISRRYYSGIDHFATACVIIRRNCRR